MTLLKVQYDLQVKNIIKYKTLSYNRDFRVYHVIQFIVAKLKKVRGTPYRKRERGTCINQNI